MSEMYLGESKMTNTEKQKRYGTRKEQELGKEKINENERKRNWQKIVETKKDSVKYKQHSEGNRSQKFKTKSYNKVDIIKFSSFGRSLIKMRTSLPKKIIPKVGS